MNLKEVVDKFYNNEDALLQWMDTLKSCEKNAPKVIAIYYHRMCNGGIERVISLLIPIFITMDYKVILITDEPPCQDDYVSLDMAKRYIIPPTESSSQEKMILIERVEYLRDILKKEKVDILCHHAYTSPVLAWDMLTAKIEGVRFIIENHQVLSGYMIFGQTMERQIKIYKRADEMIVLSELDVLFWRTQGIMARYIPNPRSEQSCMVGNRDRKKIVWVGRLDIIQKQFMDVIPIMQLVIKEEPETRLFVYGNGETARESEQLMDAIKKERLEDNIIYKGYEKNIERIYEGMGIHLLTSSFESFGMVILESRAFGIPLITYEMPYLELLKMGRGYVSVGQKDILAAAKSIIALIRDQSMWEKLATEALHSYNLYTNKDVTNMWNKVFCREPSSNVLIDKDYQVILKTAVFHYELGRKQMELQKEKNRELENRNRALQIKLQYARERKEVVLYPFGIIGRGLLKALEEERIPVAFVIDQRRYPDTDVKILKIGDLAKMDCSKYLFVLCSDRQDIHQELLAEVNKYVEFDNIFDLFP